MLTHNVETFPNVVRSTLLWGWVVVAPKGEPGGVTRIVVKKLVFQIFEKEKVDRSGRSTAGSYSLEHEEFEKRSRRAVSQR